MKNFYKNKKFLIIIGPCIAVLVVTSVIAALNIKLKNTYNKKLYEKRGED